MDHQGNPPRLAGALRNSAAALCVSLGLIGAAVAADDKPCSGPCVTVPTSVAHNSGAREAVKEATTAIKFTGEALTPESKDAVTKLAGVVKAAPAKFVLHASVDSEKGMEQTAAFAQRKARAAALTKALVDAGVPAAQVSVKAH